VAEHSNHQHVCNIHQPVPMAGQTRDMTQIDENDYPMKSMTLMKGALGVKKAFGMHESLVRTVVSTGKVHRKERFLQGHREHGAAMQ